MWDLQFIYFILIKKIFFLRISQNKIKNTLKRDEEVLYNNRDP